MITEIELLSFPNLTAAQEQAVVALLGDVTVVGIGPDIKKYTIELRRTLRLRVPDAIIAATAMSAQAQLITNDFALSSITNLQCRRIQLKSSAPMESNVEEP